MNELQVYVDGSMVPVKDLELGVYPADEEVMITFTFIDETTARTQVEVHGLAEEPVRFRGDVEQDRFFGKPRWKFKGRTAMAPPHRRDPRTGLEEASSSASARSGLVEFLRARLDEDEAMARSARGDNERLEHGYEVREDWGRWVLEDQYGSLGVVDEDGNHVTFDQEGLSDSVTSPAIGKHIARHDPARVLREVEAKRRILDAVADDIGAGGAEGAWAEYAGHALASVYADHPDYREEWR